MDLLPGLPDLGFCSLFSGRATEEGGRGDQDLNLLLDLAVQVDIDLAEIICCQLVDDFCEGNRPRRFAQAEINEFFPCADLSDSRYLFGPTQGTLR
jgi:hypothetical protein